MNKSTDDLFLKKELERFKALLGGEHDPVMLILRGHLFTESMLERIIFARLPRGDKLIEKGNLNYHQKLVLVDSFNCTTDSLISSLRGLNKLRNECAHELDKKIIENDVTRIGSPLGKQFTQFKKEANFDEVVVLRKVIDFICGMLSGIAITNEYPQDGSDAQA